MKQIKLLIVFPRTLWLTKMSPARKHQIQAIGRDVENFRCWLSGPGFAGWDDNKWLADNAAHACAGETPDIIRIYKPLGSEKYGFAPIKGLDYTPAPICLAYNETWDEKWTTEEIRQSYASFVVMHHENGHEYVDWLPKYHLPHAAERSIYYSENQDRPIDVLLTGAIGEKHYPLRCRFAEMIEAGVFKDLHCVIRPHPGYEMRSEDHWQRQLEDYAWTLSRSKVVLCCTSRHRYALAKIPEALAAGCAVVTDAPRDNWFAEHLEGACLLVGSDGYPTDTNPDWIVEYCQAIRDRGWPYNEFGQKAYLNHATCEHYAERFARACRRFLGWDSAPYAP